MPVTLGDAGAQGSCAARPAYSVGQRVVYTRRLPEQEAAVVAADGAETYIVRFPDGSERSTVEHRLRRPAQQPSAPFRAGELLLYQPPPEEKAATVTVVDHATEPPSYIVAFIDGSGERATEQDRLAPAAATCRGCCAELGPLGVTFSPDCCCACCLPCAQEYLCTVSQDAPGSLRCPCQQLVDWGQLRRIARPEDFERIDALAAQMAYAQCEEFVYCSAPGCGSGQLHDSAGGHIMTCHLCSARSCASCRAPWHEGQSCAEYQAAL
eukprot:TRINITY_DN15488_c0_g3_i1.p1 TRINITY_DN15488_c0_g3~~TRINITY_DN15488_c0_g3_i1.p1  ORF type:complete len:300 (+),score=97.99 TRINITY_DN15488_c0_g3_i1:100-900(+)